MATPTSSRRLRARPQAAARASRFGPYLALGIVAVGWTAVLLYVGRTTDFFYDEWAFIQDRRGWSLGTFLEPNNEHLAAIPVAIYKLLFATVGIEHYWPYRLVAVAGHLLCAALLFIYARRRVGAWLAVAAASLLLGLGAAWQDLLWPFQVQYFGSVAAGLGALLALDRQSREGDVAAGVLVAASIACSGIGLAVAAGIGLEVLLRSDRWRRVWIVAVPLALYALWYGQYGTGPLQASDKAAAPRWALDSAAAAIGALAGPGIDWGRPLLVVSVAALAWWLGTRALWSPRVAGVALIAVAFWALTAWGRAGVVPPDASRYLYPGAAFALVVAVEAYRRAAQPLWLLGAACLLVCYSALANLGPLRDGARGLRSNSVVLDAELAALELARDRVSPDFSPDPVRAPVIRAGRYLAAIDDLGSPAQPARELPSAPGSARAAADAVSLGALQTRLVPARGALTSDSPAPAVIATSGSRPVVASGCVTLRRGSTWSLEVAVPARGIVIAALGQAPVDVRVRRFADSYERGGVGTVAPGTAATLRIQADRDPRGWTAQLTGSGAGRACTASG